MCSICDSTCPFVDLGQVEGDIKTFGFAMVRVEGGSRHPPWVQSIGLVETSGQPELVVVGEDLDDAEDILRWVGGAVVDGERLTTDMDVVLDGVAFHVNDLPSEVLARPGFDGWRHYYTWRDERPPPELAAQRLRRCRAQHTPRNRAERRLQARGGRHHQQRAPR